MKDSIIEKAKHFAKANKVSGAKLIEFLESLDELKAKGSGKRGRITSDRILELRQQLSTIPSKQGGYSCKELAQKFSASPVEVNNSLKYLQAQGKAVIVGKQSKPKGVRGKAASLWNVV